MTKSKSKKRKLTHHSNANPHHLAKRQQYASRHGTDGAGGLRQQQSMTQEEIWDDSALLRSWDEAVAEYEFYHSIHARGEDVDEVLRQHHAATGNDNSDDVDRQHDGADVADDESEEGEVVEGGGDGDGDGDDNENDDADGEEGQIIEDALTSKNAMPLDAPSRSITTGITTVAPTAGTAGTAAGATTHVNGTTNPEPSSTTPSESDLTATAQSQTLENIKMAYYWAGYYSGLHDGQQQQQQQQQ